MEFVTQKPGGAIATHCIHLTTGTRSGTNGMEKIAAICQLGPNQDGRDGVSLQLLLLAVLRLACTINDSVFPSVVQQSLFGSTEKYSFFKVDDALVLLKNTFWKIFS